MLTVLSGRDVPGDWLSRLHTDDWHQLPDCLSLAPLSLPDVRKLLKERAHSSEVDGPTGLYAQSGGNPLHLAILMAERDSGKPGTDARRVMLQAQTREDLSRLTDHGEPGWILPRPGPGRSSKLPTVTLTPLAPHSMMPPTSARSEAILSGTAP